MTDADYAQAMVSLVLIGAMTIVPSIVVLVLSRLTREGRWLKVAAVASSVLGAALLVARLERRNNDLGLGWEIVAALVMAAPGLIMAILVSFSSQEGVVEAGD